MAAGLVATMVALQDETETTENNIEQNMTELEGVSNSDENVPTVYEGSQTDYTEQLFDILGLLQGHSEQYEAIIVQQEGINTELIQIKEFNSLLAGFGLFIVICTLCRYIYGFFKLFI